MIRQRIFSTRITTMAFALLFIVALLWPNGAATTAPQAKADADDQKKPDVASLAAQIKELQKQVAELQARSSDSQAQRIVAAGTATYRRPQIQDNKTSTRVKLNADIAAKLGDEYIVLITNRFPTGGYPFFSAYWTPAKDGFDISLVDDSIGDGTTAEYTTNKNKTYLIDWIVVKK